MMLIDFMHLTGTFFFTRVSSNYCDCRFTEEERISCEALRLVPGATLAVSVEPGPVLAEFFVEWVSWFLIALS